TTPGNRDGIIGPVEHLNVPTSALLEAHALDRRDGAGADQNTYPTGLKIAAHDRLLQGVEIEGLQPRQGQSLEEAIQYQIFRPHFAGETDPQADTAGVEIHIVKRVGLERRSDAVPIEIENNSILTARQPHVFETAILAAVRHEHASTGSVENTRRESSRSEHDATEHAPNSQRRRDPVIPRRDKQNPVAGLWNWGLRAAKSRVGRVLQRRGVVVGPIPGGAKRLGVHEIVRTIARTHRVGKCRPRKGSSADNAGKQTARVTLAHFSAVSAAAEPLIGLAWSHCIHMCPTINCRSSAICMSSISKWIGWRASSLQRPPE